MKFNKLNVPETWKHYWSRYPEGYTILEALISWVSQVDSMVDHQNKLNDNVEQIRNEIDTFVARFDGRLQEEVIEILSDWQESGFIDVVISEALQWQLDDYIVTNEQDKLSLSQQLAETEQELTTQLEQMNVNVKNFGAKGDNVHDDTDAIQSAIDYVNALGGGVVFIPQGVYKVRPDVITITNAIILKGVGKARFVEYGQGTTLQFYGTGQTGILIEPAIEGGKAIGSQLADFRMIGSDDPHVITKVGNAILMKHGSYNITLENLDIQFFKTGVRSELSWNNIFEKVTTNVCKTGFEFKDGCTSSVFNGCLAHNADVGFHIDCGMGYCSFIACATDGTKVGVKVTQETLNTGFYNFGFENYETCWYIDHFKTIVNIHGFFEWNGSNYKDNAKEIFYINTAKRVNLWGCYLDTETKLLTINKDNNRLGNIRSYGSYIKNSKDGDLTGLEYVIQEDKPFGMLSRKIVSTTTKLYEGTVVSKDISSSVNVPENGDAAYVRVEVIGESPDHPTFSGGVYNYMVRNVGGVVQHTASSTEGIIYSSFATTYGRGFRVRLSDDELNTLKVRYNVSIMIEGSNGAVVNTSDTLPVAVDV